MKSLLKSLYQYSKNKEIKELILDTFNKSWIIRSSVAQNTSTPISILEFLSNDKEPVVRAHIARNPNTPFYILNKLRNDKDHFVHINVVYKYPTLIK